MCDRNDARWLREGGAVVGRPREEHGVVPGVARVLRPGDVDVARERPCRLVGHDIDLVLEEAVAGGPLLDQHGAVVARAVAVVAGDEDTAVDRLGAVEADERVEEPPVAVEDLARIPGSVARPVRR